MAPPATSITKEDVTELRIGVLCAPEPGHMVDNVKAYSLKDVPGLAVARTFTSEPDGELKMTKNSWHIVHIQSGRKIFTPWPTAMQGLIVTRVLGSLTTWDRPREELQHTKGLKDVVAQAFKNFSQVRKA